MRGLSLNSIWKWETHHCLKLLDAISCWMQCKGIAVVKEKTPIRRTSHRLISTRKDMLHTMYQEKMDFLESVHPESPLSGDSSTKGIWKQTYSKI